MIVSCYLVVQGKRPRIGPKDDSRREPGNLRLTKTRPNTAADELAVKLDVEIPDSLFVKPTLEARIQVADTVSAGPVITTEVVDNLAQIIQERTGLSVKLSAVEEGES